MNEGRENKEVGPLPSALHSCIIYLSPTTTLRKDTPAMTELIWDGKYRDGKKVPPRRIILPFQTIETVNESTADRHRTLDMFAAGKPAEWRNRLIWGDKVHVLPSLLPEFAGKVNLIYIDPPFDTGANFSYLATIPDAPTAPQPHSPTAPQPHSPDK